ncbi:MAG: hypothetical protein PF690_18460 [Deltaproteobacteria bacterium]|nr:hypothetical protein [Deltaproteobacteria bacterium]
MKTFFCLCENLCEKTHQNSDQDPIVFGVMGSAWLGFGVVSLFGLRPPLKFSPILLLQLVYKLIWLFGVILPLILSGNFPLYAILYLVIFITYIVGDLISIPFSYIFKKGEEA